MATENDLGQVIEQYPLALGEFLKGDPEPLKMMYSHREEEVTLANPFGPPARGWEQVNETLKRAAAHYRDGEIVGFENLAKYVTSELA